MVDDGQKKRIEKCQYYTLAEKLLLFLPKRINLSDDNHLVCYAFQKLYFLYCLDLSIIESKWEAKKTNSYFEGNYLANDPSLYEVSHGQIWPRVTLNRDLGRIKFPTFLRWVAVC
jgi:hypothetical protein